MNEQPEILSFVKAMASADRLRIVGLLSQGSKRAAEIDMMVTDIAAANLNDHRL